MRKIKIGRRLKFFRQQNKMKQKIVAKALGHPDAKQISAWENDRLRPVSYTQIKLAFIYRCFVEDFYKDQLRRIQRDIENNMGRPL